MQLLRKFIFFSVFLSGYEISQAQLVITAETNATKLAQTLVGDGVLISNATLNHVSVATGLFNNISGTNIGIDSGIVLTSGRAKSDFRPPIKIGLDGNNTLPASFRLADSQLGFAGDPDLSALVGGKATHDAIILEFDFIPLGDSIKFKYVLSSEEYPEYACTPPPNDFYDVFGFFISGPGYAVPKNIALIPGTNTEVSIHTINDVGCSLYPQYYIDNARNTFFLHDGHTTVLTALASVTPCQTYHLKLAIADVSDAAWDSGVFLEAKSLSSNIIKITNLTQTDPTGNRYLVEGCATGSFKIKRPYASSNPLAVTLNYGGTALNNIDVQSLPTLVVIPANDTVVTVNVIPIIDNTPEGIEELKIYALAGCSNQTPTDSAIIQIRDYDILGITPDSTGLCRGTAVQLIASAGYSAYHWDVNPTLSNTGIRDPVARPVFNETTYICTAQEGTCNAKDSALIKLRQLDFITKEDIHCQNGTTGQIKVEAGWEWTHPVEFSLNNAPYQPDSNFNNLPIGTYKIKVRDATGCLDSLSIDLIQTHPNLVISNIATTPAGCSGLPDGTITTTVNGGLPAYAYSIDGVNYQTSNIFNLLSGNYQVKVLDLNGCAVNQPVFIPFLDSITVDAGLGNTICEGKTTLLTGNSNASQVLWSPQSGLTSPTALATVAKPSVTTKYYLTATSGICVHSDSVDVIVNPAPVPNAGSDIVTCYGEQTHLHGNGGTAYFWGPSSYLNNTNIANPVSGTPASIVYYLWVKDAIGCESLKSDSVHVKVIPQVRIFAGNDTTVALQQPLQLFASETSTSGVTQFTWSPSYGLNNGFIYNPVALLDKDMVYRVTGTTPDGCFATDEIKIRVIKGPDIYVPNSFTPNGDGLNDVLRPIPVGIKQFNYFKIFNRWGQLVYSSNNPKQGWDGKIKGVLQVNTSFVWLAEGVDYKGNVIQRKGSGIALQ